MMIAGVFPGGCIPTNNNADLSQIHASAPDCLACHSTLSAAGTVFADRDGERPLAGATLQRLGDDARWLATTDDAGLFIVESALPAGTSRFRLGEVSSEEHRLPDDASCNTCHRPGEDDPGPLVAADLFAPSVVSTTPEDGDTGVSADTEIEVVFSEPISPQSVGPSSVRLRCESGAVGLEFTAVADGDTIIAQTEEALAGRCALSIERGLTDAAGNPLDEQVTIDFRASGGGAPIVAETFPASGAVNVDPAMTVEILVDPALDPISVTAETVQLDETCDRGGTVLDHAVLDHAVLDHAVLDQAGSMIFLTPIAALPEGTTCTVVVSGLVSAAGVPQEGEHVLGFTTWPDTTAPTPQAWVPSPGRHGVGRGVVVQIAWDESLTGEAALRVEADGQSIAGIPELEDHVLTWAADEALPADSVVVVTVEIPPQDAAGNAAIAPAPWSFVVGQSQDDGSWENSLPRVTATNPSGEAEDVSVDVEMAVFLNEDPDLRTLTSENLALTGDMPVALQIGYREQGIRLQPLASLQEDTRHRLEVGARISDLSGNEMASGEVVVFWTAASADAGTPSFDGIEEIEGVSTDALSLSWSPGTDRETPASALRYHLYLSTQSGGQDLLTPTATADVGATSMQVSGLASGTTYHAIVRVEDGDGNIDANTTERAASTWASYTENIAPLLTDACASCHSESRAAGGLDVTSYSALVGSDAVVPYDSGASTLVTKGSHHGSGWFSGTQEDLVAGWIDQGALNN